MPEDTPVTIPVVEPTVAIATLLLLHVPLPVASLKGSVEPTDTPTPPEMGVGEGFAVMVKVAIQPVDATQVIVATPAERPKTRPAEDTVATAVLLLLQVLPAGPASVSALPTQRVFFPVIVGVGVTVTIAVA